MAIDPTGMLVRAENFTAAPLDDDLVILSLASNEYIALDDIGRSIWNLLETPQRFDQLCLQLGLVYEGTPEEIANDLQSFLHELERAGLVHVTVDVGR